MSQSKLLLQFVGGPFDGIRRVADEQHPLDYADRLYPPPYQHWFTVVMCDGRWTSLDASPRDGAVRSGYRYRATQRIGNVVRMEVFDPVFTTSRPPP